MLQIKDDQELITTLNELFLPLAPTLKISLRENLKFDVSELTPQSLVGYTPICWQHVGLKLPYFTNIYNSIRINRFNPVSEERINQRAFAVISPIGVADYKGKKFVLSINVNSDVKDLVLKPYMGRLNFVKDSIISSGRKAVCFRRNF